MAKLSYLLRGEGKVKTVFVRYVVGSDSFSRKTEAKCTEKDINLVTGMVKLSAEDAAQKNDAIGKIRSRFLMVLKTLKGIPLEPTVANFRTHYDVLESRLNVWNRTEVREKVQLFKNTIIDDLYLDIARLEGELEAKRTELNKYLYPDGQQPQLPLLKEAFDLYTSTNVEIKDSTKKNYKVSRDLWEREHPGLEIRELNLALVEAFRDRLKARKVKSSTIGEHFIRLKAVLKCYQERNDESLNLGFLSKVKLKADPDDAKVIFLRPAQLNELFNLDGLSDRQRKIRDYFLLARHTGLRHSDLHFNPDNISDDNYLHLVVQKTGRRLTVPMTPRALELVDRIQANPAPYSEQWVGNFSAEVKLICQKVPSMQVATSTHLHKNSAKKPLWEQISSKVGRKTFINLCMLKGIAEERVAKWVGHKDTSMIEQHYLDHQAASDQERSLLDDSF